MSKSERDSGGRGEDKGEWEMGRGNRGIREKEGGSGSGGVNE